MFKPSILFDDEGLKMAIVNLYYKRHKFIEFNNVLMKFFTAGAIMDEGEIKDEIPTFMRSAAHGPISLLTIVFISNLYKTINVEVDHTCDRPVTSWELTTLDYLRCIPGKRIFYFLMALTSGSIIIWRMYLKYVRPWCEARDLSRWKQNLILFFFHGPSAINWLDFGPQLIAVGVPPNYLEESIPKEGESAIIRLINRGHWLIGPSPGILSYNSADLPQNYNLGLANQLSSNSWRRLEAVINNWEKPKTFDYQITRNPVKLYNELNINQTCERWKCLASSVYLSILVACTCTIPLFVSVGKGLSQLIEDSLPYTEDQEADASLNFLKTFGYLEIFYLFYQICVLITSTGMMMTLFKADLVYRVCSITRDVKNMCRSYEYRQILIDRGINYKIQTAYTRWPNRIELNELIADLQFRISAYFDYLTEIDKLMSRFILLATVAYIAAIICARGYMGRRSDWLSYGFGPAIISNIVNYLYLCCLSWDLERRTRKTNTHLSSIVVHEEDVDATISWEEILEGYWSKDRARGFTIGGMFDFGLFTALRILLALLAGAYFLHTYKIVI